MFPSLLILLIIETNKINKYIIGYYHLFQLEHNVYIRNLNEQTEIVQNK